LAVIVCKHKYYALLRLYNKTSPLSDHSGMGLITFRMLISSESYVCTLLGVNIRVMVLLWLSEQLT